MRVRGKHVGAEIVIAPSKIAHLLERGGKRIRAKPVITPAIRSTEQQFMSALADGLRKGIEELLK